MSRRFFRNRRLPLFLGVLTRIGPQFKWREWIFENKIGFDFGFPGRDVRLSFAQLIV